MCSDGLTRDLLKRRIVYARFGETDKGIIKRRREGIIAQLVLPAIGTLYFALAEIWNFPYAEQIVGTITAIDAFLGTVLKLSSDSYYKKIE